MKSMRIIVLIIILAVTNSISAATITVSAAASLKDVMTEIKKAYEIENKVDKLIFNFGGSGSLQQQIENGAPVDIFISAAQKQIDELDKKNLLVKTSKVNLLKNEVVLVTPISSKLAIKSYKDLVNKNIITIGIGEPKSVPAGQYSIEIFNKLGINEKISSKLVYGKDVRTILSWVETGNVDAGIVYKTDAISSDKVKVVSTAPKDSHTPVIYPAAIVSDSKLQNESKKFLKFLKSKKAIDIFIKFGFSPIK